MANFELNGSTGAAMVTWRPGQNGFTGVGQNQMLAGEDAVATLSQSIDKGGMRGLGLLAFAIAEFELKQKAIDLGQDYYNTNQQDYTFFANRHEPQMAQSASEVLSQTLNPTYSYDYYAFLPGGIASSSINEDQWFEARRRMPKYSVGASRRLDYDMAVVRTHAVLSGWNLGTRYGLTWTDQHNLRAYNRILGMANIGIGVGSIAREGLAAAVGEVSNAYDHLGDTVASIGNGLAAQGGYNAGRTAARSMYGVPTMGMK